MLIVGDPVNMKYYYIAFYSLMQISNIQMYNNTSVQMPGTTQYSLPEFSIAIYFNNGYISGYFVHMAAIFL